MGFSTGAMPPSNQGRKPIPCESKILDPLVEFLADESNRVLSIGDDLVSPGYIGPDDRKFDKDHRAQSDGRRYAKEVSKAVGCKVSVNVYDNGQTGAAQKFLWRLYVPLSESQSIIEALNEALEDEALEEDDEVSLTISEGSETTEEEEVEAT